MKWEPRILPRSFFDRDPATVARDLLGKFLVRKEANVYRVGMITEVEAYLPEGDLAAHGRSGPTRRNASLYKVGGHAYVHRMRQYCLLDIVTGIEGVASSVLIRSLEPLDGILNRADGPARLCREMNITHEMDGIDMTDPAGGLFVSSGDKDLLHDITTSNRIGISKSADLPLRFYISRNIHVSHKK